jgi:hypothetical protein
MGNRELAYKNIKKFNRQCIKKYGSNAASRIPANATPLRSVALAGIGSQYNN